MTNLTEYLTSENYLTIFKTIDSQHKTYNAKWLNQQKGIKHLNLKKTEIRYIINNENDSPKISKDFYDYVINYKSQLIHLYADIISKINEDFTSGITGRVKNEDSIINKLQKKITDQNGKFAINKVLNDLLGFRIIDKNYDYNITEIIEMLDMLKSDGFRIQHKERINGDYIAYHIYFMGKDSKHFPVELQIWDIKNVKNNFESHEIYKKDYTSWPEIYKKG